MMDWTMGGKKIVSDRDRLYIYVCMCVRYLSSHTLMTPSSLGMIIAALTSSLHPSNLDNSIGFRLVLNLSLFTPGAGFISAAITTSSLHLSRDCFPLSFDSCRTSVALLCVFPGCVLLLGRGSDNETMDLDGVVRRATARIALNATRRDRKKTHRDTKITRERRRSTGIGSVSTASGAASELSCSRTVLEFQNMRGSMGVTTYINPADTYMYTGGT